MVSIILPTYNSIEFLQERLQSILNQTYSDWECIIIDGYSTDGTWEYLKQNEDDKRFRFHQFPAKGPYDAWNKGIELATGQYIYIATADDTMDHRFLEIMVKGLEVRENCHIAHCKLTIIDRHGRKSSDEDWDSFYPSQFYGELMNKMHIRFAPHDAILYCFLKTVYTSVTQLLIKRDVFKLSGLFKTDQGSIADFEWGLRVALKFNTLHIPLYLATWRKHESQLTTDNIQTDYCTYSYLFQTVNAHIKGAISSLKMLDVLRLRYFFLNDMFYYYFQRKNTLVYRVMKRALPLKKSNNIEALRRVYKNNELKRLLQLC